MLLFQVFIELAFIYLLLYQLLVGTCLLLFFVIIFFHCLLRFWIVIMFVYCFLILHLLYSLFRFSLITFQLFLFCFLIQFVFIINLITFHLFVIDFITFYLNLLYIMCQFTLFNLFFHVFKNPFLLFSFQTFTLLILNALFFLFTKIRTRFSKLILLSIQICLFFLMTLILKDCKIFNIIYIFVWFIFIILWRGTRQQQFLQSDKLFIHFCLDQLDFFTLDFLILRYNLNQFFLLFIAITFFRRILVWNIGFQEPWSVFISFCNFQYLLTIIIVRDHFLNFILLIFCF